MAGMAGRAGLRCELGGREGERGGATGTESGVPGVVNAIVRARAAGTTTAGTGENYHSVYDAGYKDEYGLIHNGGWCDVGRPDCIAEAEALLAGKKHA